MREINHGELQAMTEHYGPFKWHVGYVIDEAGPITDRHWQAIENRNDISNRVPLDPDGD